jgi:predicted Zn-ribbon and HTH transcriptional regulator
MYRNNCGPLFWLDKVGLDIMMQIAYKGRMKIERPANLMCNRCGHHWILRVAMPLRCPKCGTQKWAEAPPKKAGTKRMEYRHS